MPNIGNLANLIKAEVVKLQIGANNELITLFNIRGPSKKPDIIRVNSRAGALDFASFPVEEITADAVISKDVLTEMETLSTMNSRGVLPKQSYVIVALDESGSNDTGFTFDAIMTFLDYVAADKGSWNTTFTLRLVNSSRVQT